MDYPNRNRAGRIVRHLSLGTAGTTTAQSAGMLYGWHLQNEGGSTAYVKFYDKATAAVAADTPFLTLAIPAGDTLDTILEGGLRHFDLGLSVRATLNAADADNTAPAANVLGMIIVRP